MKIYRIKPGSKVKLTEFDPEGQCDPAENKDLCLARLVHLKDAMLDLQRLLHAEHEKRLLIILQGMDASGKDGTVRQVFSGLDPHGFRVAAFKAPTAEELDHDFLWRVHARVPAKGEVVVFNRSHYEDIVAVKVKNLRPKEEWEKRFEHVVNFERLLVDEGTTVLKFFLHVSREEQRRRLQGRLENPKKHWKFHPEDLRDRERWPEFVEAYEETMSRTSWEGAPWHVIPADNKWYRNVVVAEIVRDTLAKLEPAWPQPQHNVRGLVVK